jgi:hypothetical protein
MPHLTPSSHSLAHVPGAAPATSSKKNLIVVALLLVVASAVATVLYIKNAKQPPPSPPAVADAHLTFVIEPAGSLVEVGGKDVGSTSPLETTVAPGVYSLAVKHDGFKTWTGSITLSSGESQTINVALEKSPVVAIAPAPPDAAIDPPSDGPDDAAEAHDIDRDEPPSTRSSSHERRHASKGHHVVESPPVANPRVETKVEPPPKDVEPSKDTTLEPPKETKLPPPKDTKIAPPKDTPPADTRPARTPVVAASAVSKLSGDVPVLRGSSGSGDVLAKMCIDESGKVTSVKIVKSPPDISSDLQRALMGWRYAPYRNKESKLSPVCFPLALRVVVKN